MRKEGDPMKNSVAKVVLISSIMLLLVACGSKYDSIDTAQSTAEKYEAIADYMDNYLDTQGYYVLEYSIEWVGYSKYKDNFSEEEFEALETGGYYSYLGRLSSGDVAIGRIQTYWETSEIPVILNLVVESTTDLSEIELIEYSEENFTKCWATYQEKCAD